MENFAQSIPTQPASAVPTGIADTGVASGSLPGSTPGYAPPMVPVSSSSSPPNRLGTFFDGITLLDIGMIALSTLALFMSIYYTRQQIFYLKANKSRIGNDIDELKINVKSIMGDDYKSLKQ